MLAYEEDTFDRWLRDAVEMEARQMRRGSLLVFRDDKLASTFDVSGALSDGRFPGDRVTSPAVFRNGCFA